MSGIARIGADSAGGPHITSLQSSVFVNGLQVQTIGGNVAGHGKNEHSGPVMVTGSGTVFAEGIPVCRQGDAASCGHTSTGSGNVSAG